MDYLKSETSAHIMMSTSIVVARLLDYQTTYYGNYSNCVACIFMLLLTLLVELIFIKIIQ